MSSALPAKPDGLAALSAVECEVARLLAQPARPRPERLSGIHNPWGPAAGLVDAWAFLALCEADETIDEAAGLLGPDIVLWDSELFLEARSYQAFVAQEREGRYWPVDPLVGAVVTVPLQPGGAPRALPVPGVETAALGALNPGRPLYAIRYMPATSHYRRDASFPPNRIAMEERVLINYPTRPLWLVRGEDRAGNDFVTGFAPATPRWAAAPQQGK